MNTHHIMTLYYQPTDEAKKIYDGFKEQFGDDMMFVNCGSIDRSDDWVKKNVVFESDYKDNISKLNPHWCELTTYYLVWKNMLDKWSDDDYVQHSHYRKWLEIGQEADPNTDIWTAYDYPMEFNTEGKHVITNVENGFRICHPASSWDIMESVVHRHLTFHEVDWWNEWKNQNYLVAPMNLFRMRLPLFREWCEWLFPIAFEIEKRIPYDHPDYQTAYQRRAMAFISERLFSFWCWANWRRGKNLVEQHVRIEKDFKPITDREERGIKL